MSFIGQQTTFDAQQNFCFPTSQVLESNHSYHQEKENIQNDTPWFYSKDLFEVHESDQQEGALVEPSPTNENSQLLDPPNPARTAMMCFALSKSTQDDAEGSKKIDIASIAEEYAALSPEQKMFWEEESRKDKERYRMELEKHSGEYRMPKRRAKKHPLAPKRPMSAFLKYSKDKRKEVKEANPDLNNTDISRLLGQMWNEATEQEKEPYVTEELTARAAYKYAIAKFRVSQRNQEMDAIRYATKIRSTDSYSSRNVSEGITPSRANNGAVTVREVSPTEHAHVTTSVFEDCNKHDSMPPLSNSDNMVRVQYHSGSEYSCSYHHPKAPNYHREDHDRFHHRDYYYDDNYKRSRPSKESHQYTRKNEMDYYYYHNDNCYFSSNSYDAIEDKRAGSDRRPSSPAYGDTSNVDRYRNGHLYDKHDQASHRQRHENKSFAPYESEAGHYDSYWNHHDDP